MELISRRSDGIQTGTAGDHWALARAHTWHALRLQICGPTKSSTAVTPVVKPAEMLDGSKEAVEPSSCVILPSYAWKESWDLAILMAILYSAVTVPYRICFSATTEPGTNMYLFEQTVTVLFITDVLLNFNTAYMEDGVWVTHRGAIARTYLSGWFWIDFPSSVPVELIDFVAVALEGAFEASGADEEEGGTSHYAFLRFLRLFRLLRLMRLLKLNEYISTMEIRFDLNLTSLRLFQMIVSLLFLAHMLGCFWFYTATLVGLDPEIVTWVSSYNGGSALDATPDVQYLYALYWALTTLTTVGYGDIIPTNNAERTFCMVSFIVGALVFGYMLSSIASLVNAMDRQAAINEAKMDEVKEYMRWRQVPRDLKMRLRRYYSHYYSKKTVFDEEAILGSLSPELRFEVVRHALKETIGRIPLFGSTLAPFFQLEVFPLLKPLAAVSGELILRRGDVPTDLLFLLKGVIEVVSGVHGKPLYRLHQGQHFGESVLTGRRRSANHVAESPCEMLAISAADLSDLFDRRPREGRSMYRALLNEHKRKELMRTIGLRFQMGHLKEVGRIEDAYAIALQLAWNRHCDRVAFALVEDIWQPEDTTLESTISGSIIAPRALVASLTDHHVSRHGSPSLSKPPTSPNAGAAGAETFAGGFGAAGADAAFSKRLLRVDGLLAKLEALAVPLEQALGATSRGDLKPKLSDRLRH